MMKLWQIIGKSGFCYIGFYYTNWGVYWGLFGLWGIVFIIFPLFIDQH